MYFETECEISVQGHPRSIMSVSIKSEYATSYWSSIVTLVLYCPVTEILQVFCSERRPHPYSTRILGCSLSTAKQHQLTVRRCRRITFGRPAFSVAGPTVWNSLPTEFRALSVGFGDFKCTRLRRYYSRDISAFSAIEMFA